MEKIDYGNYYHIYNRGTDGMVIFRKDDDYLHFLSLISIYLEPIAEIFAYALMGNHFHFLLRIKDENEIGYLHPKYAKSDKLNLKWKTFFLKDVPKKQKNNFRKKPIPENMFQHLFLTYAKRFNKKHNRTGSLIEHPFKRIHVDNEKYLKRLILYIHNNPVKHGICNSTVEYPWTSYLSIISNKPTKLSRDFVIDLFDSKANYRSLHEKPDSFNDIDFLLFE